MAFFDAWERSIEKSADRLIWVFVAAYVVFFSALSFLKFYAFGYYDWDFASDITVLWNSIHGDFLYYPFLEQNIFGAHLYLIILFILPIYALLQSPLCLLFLQSLFLGLAAYPLYLFARTKVPKTAALVVSVLYLLYPSVGFINLFETHFEIYEIFFIFFALYFFEKERFVKFMGFLVLAAMCKENVSFVIFMFGIYGFFRKRRLRWVLTPMVFGAAWFLIAVKGIIPYFARDARLYQEGFIFSVYYKHLGATMTEMLTTIIAHPVAVARFALTPEKIVYLFRLFAPVGFLSFFGLGPLLMTVPIFMQNLLSSAWTHAQIQYQYAGLLIPFIFASLVVALKRFWEVAGFVRYRFVALVFLLAASTTAGICFKAPQFSLPSYFASFRIDEGARLRRELVALVPVRAPVIATFRFLPWLANRRELTSWHLVTTGHRMYTAARYVPPENLEYALVDFDDPLTLNSFFPEEAPANASSFLDQGPWKVVAGAGEVILLRKGAGADRTLFGLEKDPVPEKYVRVNIGDQFEFLGYNKTLRNLGSWRILGLSTFWKRTGGASDPVGLFILGFDKQGREAFAFFHPLGYRVRPVVAWPKDVFLREELFIPIPERVPAGEYTVRAGVVNLRDFSLFKLVDQEKGDALEGMDLGQVKFMR
jgi:uncharacterized membrane protein